MTNCATLEPHVPHVLIENGDMTQEEYDEYLHSRSDFIKATKKDSSNERKVSVHDMSTTPELISTISHCFQFEHDITNNSLWKILFIWLFVEI